MKRKIPLMIITILLLQVLLPVLTIIWESGFTIKSIAATTYEATANGITWTYELNNNQAINVEPKDKATLRIQATQVEIPSKLNYEDNEYNVTSIGEGAFSYFENLVSITIPNSVTSIGSYAFRNCNKLTSIEIPEGLTTIEEGVFYDCESLTSITIPNSVTSIDWYAFSGCSSLESINFSEGSQLTSISPSAFSGCNKLTSITIPSSVTSIGRAAFDWCSSLTSINFSEGSQLTSIGAYAFRDCNKLESITIPNSVTSIGDSAFESCSSLASIAVDKGNQKYSSDEEGILFDKNKTTLIRYPIGKSDTEYEIPSNVTSIGNYAFEGDGKLTSITIPSSVINVEVSAFDGCMNLASIAVDEGNQKYSSDEEGILFDNNKTTLIRYPIGKSNTEYEIPSSVTSIKENAFKGYGMLKTLIISEGITSIGNGAFESNNITSIIISEGVTSIVDYAFGGCSGLTSITIPSSVISIGESAFLDCSNLTSITIPNSVTSIGSSAFKGCSNLTSITIPNSVTSIEDNTFYGCSNLTSITIPNSVTSVGYNPFYGCSNLTSIEIPEGVTTIKDFAFNNCSSLTNINVDKNNKSYSSENGILFNKDKTSIIKYPAGKIEQTSYIIPSSVTSIGGGAFSGCSSLKSITIPSSVTRIGDSAFSGCSSLASITIPSGVTRIGGNAFYFCSSLTSITIPNSVTSIGIRAFSNCSSLTSIIIPSSVTSIGDYAFSECSSLASITIPNSVTSIGDSAFYLCSGLTIYCKDGSTAKNYAEANYYIKYEIIEETGITVKTNPGKLTYKIGETLDTKGLVLIVTYDNGTTEEITEGYECSGYNANQVGEQTITVTYGGKTATFNVTVQDYITGITLTAPTKTTYKHGESIDTAGGSITINNASGSSEKIDMQNSNVSITEADESALNMRPSNYGNTNKIEKTLKITYTKDEVTGIVNYPIAIINDVKSIAIKEEPKKNYNINDILDLSTGTILVTRATGTQEIGLNDSRVTVTGFNSSVENANLQLKVTFEENEIKAETTYKVSVSNQTVENLQINIREYIVEQEGEIKYLSNIIPRETAGQLLEKIQVNTGATKKVYNGTTEVATDGILATGMKIVISLNDQVAEYIVVVSGDINGNGSITATDLTKMKNHILGRTTLTSVEFKAADLNNDGRITATELTKIKKYVLGFNIPLH